MKIKHLLAKASLALLSSFILHPSSSPAQGTLAPPGAPAPTMKSLAQIEPRTDVSKLSGGGNNLFIINAPGSYYLTANIVGVSNLHCISISTNNVTLDLNGFTLQGVPGSLHAIYVASCTNVTIRNGNLIGWDGDPVYSPFFTSRNIVCDRLNVSANSSGGSVYGINVRNTVVSDCVVQGGSKGIIAMYGEVRNCSVSDSYYFGIEADSCLVSGCTVQNCGSGGIFVNAPGSFVVGNFCIGNNTTLSTWGAGIYVYDSNNRIEDNHVTASGYAGIFVVSPLYSGNVVIKNSVVGNGANNYLGTAGNDFGPIGTAAAATSPWANISH